MNTDTTGNQIELRQEQLKHRVLTYAMTWKRGPSGANHDRLMEAIDRLYEFMEASKTVTRSD